MAIDPNSVSDYLRQTKMNPSLGARRNLWNGLFGSAYSGTAAQNTQLLAELRRIDEFVTLSLTSPKEIAPGEDVFCRANAPVSIRNPISGTIQTVGKGRFSLGSITQPGFYPFLVDDGVTFSSLTVIVRKIGGNLQLARVSTQGEWRSAPPSVDEVPGLFPRFIDTMGDFFATPEDIGWRFVKETATEQGLWLMMDSLLIGVGFIPGIQGVAVSVGSQAMLGFVAGFMERIITELQNHGYSQAERDHLMLVLVTIPKLAKIGISVVSIKKTDPQLCRFVSTMSASVDLANVKNDFQIKDKTLNMAMGLLWDATTKSVGLVCDIHPKP